MQSKCTVWKTCGCQQAGGTGEVLSAPGSLDAQLAARATEVMFVEAGGGEPMTFREVFLRSRALENVVAGCD